MPLTTGELVPDIPALAKTVGSQSPLEPGSRTGHDQVWTESPGSELIMPGGSRGGPLRGHIGSESFWRAQPPAEVNALAPLPVPAQYVALGTPLSHLGK